MCPPGTLRGGFFVGEIMANCPPPSWQDRNDRIFQAKLLTKHFDADARAYEEHLLHVIATAGYISPGIGGEEQGAGSPTLWLNP